MTTKQTTYINLHDTRNIVELQMHLPWTMKNMECSKNTETSKFTMKIIIIKPIQPHACVYSHQRYGSSKPEFTYSLKCTVLSDWATSVYKIM